MDPRAISPKVRCSQAPGFGATKPRCLITTKTTPRRRGYVYDRSSPRSRDNKSSTEGIDGSIKKGPMSGWLSDQAP